MTLGLDNVAWVLHRPAAGGLSSRYKRTIQVPDSDYMAWITLLYEVDAIERASAGSRALANEARPQQLEHTIVAEALAENSRRPGIAPFVLATKYRLDISQARIA